MAWAHMSLESGQSRAPTGSGEGVRELRVMFKVINTFPLHLFLITLSSQVDLHESRHERTFITVIIIIMNILVPVLTDASECVTCRFPCTCSSVSRAKNTSLSNYTQLFFPLPLYSGQLFRSSKTQAVLCITLTPTTCLPPPSLEQNSDVLKVNTPPGFPLMNDRLMMCIISLNNYYF